MTTDKKYIIAGAASILAGGTAMYMADALTLGREDKAFLSEGGFIRASIIGYLALPIGIIFLGYGIYKMK